MARLVVANRLRTIVAPLFLVLSIATFTFTSPDELTTGNLSNLLGQMAPLAIVALGQMAVLLTRGFDISVGSVAALSGVAAAAAANAVGPAGVAAAPLVGLGCGLVNGFVVGTLGVQPVIATLGMLSLARGLALEAGHGTGVAIDGSNPLAWLGYGKVAGVPWAFVLAAGAMVLLAATVKETRFGRRLLMVGSDPDAAGLVGVNARTTLLAAYGLSGLSAGTAALVYLGRAGIGLSTEGNGLELVAIAAAVIGGTALSGAVGRPWLVLVGALFVQSLSNGLNLAGTSPFVQEVILGGIIIVAGLSDRSVGRLAAAPTTKEGSSP